MNLLLLHGAIGSAAQLQHFKTGLSKKFDVHSIDFQGHGGTSLPDAPFSVDMFVNQVLDYLNTQKLEQVDSFGYSMGAFVALKLAKDYPGRVNKIISLGTKFEWNEQIAAKEVQMLLPEKIEVKLPAFANTLKERHAPSNWKTILEKTAEMMTSMGKDNPLKLSDFPKIAQPVLVMRGDRDRMVTLQETLAVFEALPNAQLCILPGTPHPAEQVDVETIVVLAEKFLA